MQLGKGEQLHQAESQKIMKENVALIKEINLLRKELSNSKDSVRVLEGTLKTTRTLAGMRGQSLPPKEETIQLSGV